MDMFIGEEVACECWQTSFLSDLKRAVAPGGALFQQAERTGGGGTGSGKSGRDLSRAAEIPTSGNSIMYWRYEDDH